MSTCLAITVSREAAELQLLFLKEWPPGLQQAESKEGGWTCSRHWGITVLGFCFSVSPHPPATVTNI